MKSPKLISSVSAALVTASLALTTAGPAHAASGDVYVALGDSYSSGVGAGAYLADSGGCHRSTLAYPYQWKIQSKPAKFSFMACSGATTIDVLNSQLGPLDASTTLVSVGAGGNDAGFSDVIRTCVLNAVDSACLNRLDQARAFANTQLPGRLDTLYDAIRQRAPKARVVVVGVPRLYTLDNGFCAGISNTKRQAINDAADALDTVMGGRAAAHGFKFADVRYDFANHGICGNEAWLQNANLSTVWESYHPTATGQLRGYLPVFTKVAR
ncbi:SGNH/GDSL hydrolase family protein [Streptomyces aureus]|uniref:SGNH/GDSL hydrolase family protein n=1 Tax=Streptomyces aureus TaxID=193461 RepID=UPI0033D51F42